MKELLDCSEWLPYSKNLELISGNYKLSYNDDNEIVYAWYCAKAKKFVIDIVVFDLDSVYYLDTPSYYMLNEE